MGSWLRWVWHLCKFVYNTDFLTTFRCCWKLIRLHLEYCLFAKEANIFSQICHIFNRLLRLGQLYMLSARTAKEVSSIKGEYIAIEWKFCIILWCIFFL
jgi:hypothetical protein